MTRIFLTAACGLAVAIGVCAGTAQADVITGYDWDDGTNTRTNAPFSTAAGVTASDIGLGAALNNSNPVLVQTHQSTTAAGPPTFGTANPLGLGGNRNLFDNNNDFANNLGQAINQGSFIGFTVSPDPGLKLNLDSFTFMSQANHVNRSLDEFALFSSATGGFTFGNQIDTGTNTTLGQYNPFSIALNGVPELQGLTDETEFRLYLFGATQNNNAGSFTGFDKVILNGTVVPEPSSLIIWGGLASVFGLVWWRRRKC